MSKDKQSENHDIHWLIDIINSNTKFFVGFAITAGIVTVIALLLGGEISIEGGGVGIKATRPISGSGSGSEPTPLPTPEPTPLPTPEPTPLPTPEPTPLPVFREIIFFEKNGTKEVCVNLPESTNNIQFHAWRSDGSGIDLPMNSTFESSCMYWINLPAGAEGGSLKINGNWAAVGDFLVRAESGCSEAVTINEGIIKASTSPNSSLLATRDSVNGDSGKWGWACK